MSRAILVLTIIIVIAHQFNAGIVLGIDMAWIKHLALMIAIGYFTYVLQKHSFKNLGRHLLRGLGMILVSILISIPINTILRYLFFENTEDRLGQITGYIPKILADAMVTLLIMLVISFVSTIITYFTISEQETI